MAIYNGRILMRKGNEADFDPSKLMSGEWAVSLDAGIVRICLEAGKVIRMATYEAFEEDMKQIEAILLECQSIEEAVRRINTEVSEKLNACAEYVQQAKSYSEQAKTSEANAKSYMQSAKTSEENAKVSETNAKASENSAKEYENSAKLTEERAREVFESIPEDYSTLSDDFYALAIKETATGYEIHRTDSADMKLREFALYGKAKQNTTSGKNLLENVAVNMQKNGITFVINEDKSITVTGTANQTSDFYVNGGYAYTENILPISSGKIISSGTKTNLIQLFLLRNEDVIAKAESGEDISISLTGEVTAVMYRIPNGVTVNNLTIYPMIRKCDENGNPIGDDTYEKYSGGMPSPNPSYPQPIEVSGESGSVEVKSCGKNLLKNTATSIEKNGLTITVNEDKSITFNGTTNGNVFVDLMMHKIHIDKGVLSGCPSGGSSNTYRLYANVLDDNDNLVKAYYDYGNGTEVDIKGRVVQVRILIANGKSVENLTFYPMLSVEGGEYEPYKETLATIPTENGLAGIKVSSNGNYTDSNGQQWICDEIVKYADGSGAFVKRIEKLSNPTFSLEKGYTLETSELFSCIAPNSYSTNNALLSTIVCNKLQFLRSVLSNDTCGAYQGYGKIFARITGVTTAEEFNALMVDSEIYYILAEPITTPLTAEEIAEIEKLHTFYPITNISNDFDCGMSVTYYADSKNYINNQLAIMKQEQEEAMMNILSLMPTEVQATMIENDTNELLKESEI